VRRLRAPLRVTWDWEWPPIARPPEPGARRAGSELRGAIGAEIVEARVLLLEVGHPDATELAGGALAAALAGFCGTLSLALDPETAAALGGSRPWEALGAEEVWLDVTPAGGAPLPGSLRRWPHVRLYLTAANVAEAAAALVGAVEGGARAVSLPNLPLFGETLRAARVLAPRPGHLREFAGLVAPALAARPEVELRVHHYGLWEELRARGLRPHGEEAPGHGGCQAGSALAYVDPAGVLYPCASLPLPIERVGPGALRRAWAGAELAALREEIARLPEACAGCPHGATCRGGCRGWAHFLSRGWDATGPDCVR
jgi:radical SAM protein with 4Fe4S-binding SPASM domain